MISGESLLAEHANDLLGAPAGADLEKLSPGQYSHAGSSELPQLKAGEGELRVVDRAFGNGPALLVRGDTKGSAAAVDYGSQHLPYLWAPSKKQASVEEIRRLSAS